jgi:hypothetical protein
MTMKTKRRWTRSWTVLVVVFAGLGLAVEAEAQLLGNRAGGGSVVRRPNAQQGQGGAGTTLESIGTIVDETARFVRGNRAVTDFVGADSGEAARFVGSLQAGATEQVQSAVDDILQLETVPDINRVTGPVVPPRLRLNAPRLELGFTSLGQAEQVTEVAAVQRLQTSLPGLDPNLFEVSVADGVATLRGTVASERDRRMAALLLGFEPGIRRVENELTVASPDRVLEVPGAVPMSSLAVDDPR